MKKLPLHFGLIFLLGTLSVYARSEYRIQENDFDFKNFPEIRLTLWTRSASDIDTNKIVLKENDAAVSGLHFERLTGTSDQYVVQNKIVFLLIENHYLPKGNAQRAFFSDILTRGLQGKIKKGDKVYIGTFDWYRDNQYLFLLSDTPVDEESILFSMINNIRPPAPLSNRQTGADIYFALDETLKFLSQLKDSLPKNILLLSDDFPNIAGQKTVEEIRTASLASDIPIYAIGYNVGADRYSLITRNEICLPTHGSYFTSPDNDLILGAQKVGEFIDIMNINSKGSTYRVSFVTQQKKTGRKNSISLIANGNTAATVNTRYPLNIWQWILANIVLTIILLVSLLFLVFFSFRWNNKRKISRKRKLQEEAEKQNQISNAESEIASLKQKQQDAEKQWAEQKHQIQEGARLEKLKQLMKAKSQFPRITYSYNGQKGQFYIDSPVFTIGRDEKTNSFAIPVPSVSRNHAEILFNENGQFLIRDLNSTNGIILNGNKETQALLKSGDQVKLGDVILKINL